MPLLRKVKIFTGCKVYLQAQNLLTITSYEVSDPEMQNYLTVPPLRTITAGIQLSF